jgi:hypothetical protein
MTSEYIVLTLGAVAAGVYVFRDSIFSGSSKTNPPLIKNVANGIADGDSRDFVAKMKAGVRGLIAADRISPRHKKYNG